MPGLQSGELILRGEDDRCALIGASPSEVIMRHRQLVLDQPEAGGLLIGYLRGRYIEVTMATGPMEGDKRKRMSFSDAPRHGWIGYLSSWTLLHKCSRAVWRGMCITRRPYDSIAYTTSIGARTIHQKPG